MGYMSKQLVEAAGRLLLDDLVRQPSLRISSLYQDGNGPTYEKYVAELGDGHFGAVDIAADQLEQAGVVSIVRNLGEMSDDTQDYLISLTKNGAEDLAARRRFEFAGVDL